MTRARLIAFSVLCVAAWIPACVDREGRSARRVRDRGDRTATNESVPREVIGSVIKAHSGEVRRCYEAQFRSHPDLAGKITVAFTIEPSGQVTDAGITENALGEKVGQCVVAAMRTWHYPRPFGGEAVRVSYPWVFTPERALTRDQ
jgi:TonB family protein